MNLADQLAHSFAEIVSQGIGRLAKSILDEVCRRAHEEAGGTGWHRVTVSRMEKASGVCGYSDKKREKGKPVKGVRPTREALAALQVGAGLVADVFVKAGAVQRAADGTVATADVQRFCNNCRLDPGNYRIARRVLKDLQDAWMLVAPLSRRVLLWPQMRRLWKIRISNCHSITGVKDATLSWADWFHQNARVPGRVVGFGGFVLVELFNVCSSEQPCFDKFKPGFGGIQTDGFSLSIYGKRKTALMQRTAKRCAIDLKKKSAVIKAALGADRDTQNVSRLFQEAEQAKAAVANAAVALERAKGAAKEAVAKSEPAAVAVAEGEAAGGAPLLKRSKHAEAVAARAVPPTESHEPVVAAAAASAAVSGEPPSKKSKPQAEVQVAQSSASEREAAAAIAVANVVDGAGEAVTGASSTQRSRPAVAAAPPSDATVRMAEEALAQARAQAVEAKKRAQVALTRWSEGAGQYQLVDAIAAGVVEGDFFVDRSGLFIDPGEKLPISGNQTVRREEVFCHAVCRRVREGRGVGRSDSGVVAAVPLCDGHRPDSAHVRGRRRTPRPSRDVSRRVRGATAGHQPGHGRCHRHPRVCWGARGPGPEVHCACQGSG